MFIQALTNFSETHQRYFSLFYVRHLFKYDQYEMYLSKSSLTQKLNSLCLHRVFI